jgi:hypothetical protein
MKHLSLITPLLFLLLVSCKNREEKIEWNRLFHPQIFKEGDTISYNSKPFDTLEIEETFKAKVYHPLKGFIQADQGKTIIEIKDIFFSIGLDTLKNKNMWEPYLKLDEFSIYKEDTLYLEIPVKNLLEKYPFKKLNWRAGITVTFSNHKDTTYSVGGRWIFNSPNLDLK